METFMQSEPEPSVKSWSDYVRQLVLLTATKARGTFQNVAAVINQVIHKS